MIRNCSTRKQFSMDRIYVQVGDRVRQDKMHYPTPPEVLLASLADFAFKKSVPVSKHKMALHESLEELRIVCLSHPTLGRCSHEYLGVQRWSDNYLEIFAGKKTTSEVINGNVSGCFPTLITDYYLFVLDATFVGNSFSSFSVTTVPRVYFLRNHCRKRNPRPFQPPHTKFELNRSIFRIFFQSSVLSKSSPSCHSIIQFLYMLTKFERCLVT